jgi:AraC-like DNA-binding protein
MPPSQILTPLVRCYTYKEFDTNGEVLVRPFYASGEIILLFFFNTKVLKLANRNTGKIIEEGSFVELAGVGTQFNGDIYFKGHYRFFVIRFTTNGFNKLFNLPSNEITNRMINAEYLFDSTIKDLYDQLSNAKEINEMANLANKYLLYYLKKQRFIDYKDSITTVSNFLLKNMGFNNISQLAQFSNMGLRNFERHFLYQVGTSPKLFCSVTRFNHAFSLKVSEPKKKWTSIVYESGYFDQMHLIRDFKKFAGSGPSSFYKKTLLFPQENTKKVSV